MFPFEWEHEPDGAVRPGRCSCRPRRWRPGCKSRAGKHRPGPVLFLPDRGPDRFATGASPAHDTRCAAAGNRDMSRPISPMIDRARSGVREFRDHLARIGATAAARNLKSRLSGPGCGGSPRGLTANRDDPVGVQPML